MNTIFGKVRHFGFAAALGLLCVTLASGDSGPRQAPDLAGTWSGTWKSCSSGHHGPLHANLCRLNENCYRADFRGRFFKVFPFQYSVNLTVTGYDGDKVLLAGQSYLGRLFGTFHYHAEVTDEKFVATYCSCRDHGQFVMCRSCQCSSRCR